MKGSTLYRKMLTTQNEYRQAFVDLDKAVKSFFNEFCDEETSRIMVDEYNFVIVRIAGTLPDEAIEKFKEEFDAVLLWRRNESIDDYRNIEETNAVVYEYGFASNLLYANNKEESDDDD